MAWIIWTLAHGLGVTAVIGMAGVVVMIVGRTQMTGLAIILGFGVVLILQQVLLLWAGLAERSWWFTSFLGWGLGRIAGTWAEQVVLDYLTGEPEIAKFYGFLVFGGIGGTIQMLSFRKMLGRALIWPLTSSLGLTIALELFRIQWLSIYVVALISGAAYGGVTGAALYWINAEVGNSLAAESLPGDEV